MKVPRRVFLRATLGFRDFHDSYKYRRYTGFDKACYSRGLGFGAWVLGLRVLGTRASGLGVH